MKAYFFALLTAGIWGFVPLLEKYAFRHPIDPLLAVTIRSLGITICFFFLLFFKWGIHPILQVETSSLIALMVAGILAAVIGYTAFYHALKAGAVSIVTPLSATYPLVTYILGVYFFHEAVTLPRLAGVGLVLAGILLLK